MSINKATADEWDKVRKDYVKAINENLEGDIWPDNVKPDLVNNPPHYTQGTIQPIVYIEANNLGYLEGNVIKYVTRYKLKNGLEDLKKAQWYLNRLVETYEG